MSSAHTKDLAYYLERPYTITLRPDEDGDIVARVVELPGCAAHGKTPEEALDNLAESKRLWLEDAMESGEPIPEPEQAQTLPSRRWLQRVPRSLHQRLSQLAKQERVSLNQLVTSMLSEAITMEYSESGAPLQPRKLQRSR